MTNLYSGYIVVLEKDMREDDAESTINAIKMIKGVSSVKPIISDINIQMAKEKARSELTSKIISILTE